MCIVRYYRERPGWDAEVVANPAWAQVEAAIRRMDDYCYPIVLLNRSPCASSDEAFEDEDAFNIVGGAGRFALFEMLGRWKYRNLTGSTAKTRLWESDQGYFCEEREVLTDLDEVLRIVRCYFDGGYDALPGTAT